MFNFITSKDNNRFMRLWWAQLISQFGDRINQMALIGLIAERAPGSVVGLAKLLAWTIIPVFVVGPIAGVFVDRWQHRKTLFICDVARGLLVLTIPFIFYHGTSMVPIYLIVFFVFCFSRFYIPAKMSIIPDLVTKENLLIANSLLTTTGMIAFVLGVALGGFIVDKLGSRQGFMVDAATFFISGLFIASIGRKISVHLDKATLTRKGRELIRMEKTVFQEIKEGIVYLATHPEIRFIMMMLFTLLSAAGAIYVVIIVFIQQSFESVTRDLGVIAVALGVGLFIGVLIYGKWGKNVKWYKTIFLSLFAGGAVICVFAVMVNWYTSLIGAVGLAFLIGIVIGPVFIASNTVVHLVSDENMRGKVFSALEIVIHFAFLVAMLVSSYLAEIVNPVWIIISVGVIFGLIGVFGLIFYKGNGELAFNQDHVA